MIVLKCPRCGPQFSIAQAPASLANAATVRLVEANGHPTEGDPIVGAVGRILEGQIVAVKGLGGFFLATRADDQAAVLRLRRSLERPSMAPTSPLPAAAKAVALPGGLTLLCADLDEARELVALSPHGEALLTGSPVGPWDANLGPIVWAKMRPWNRLAPAITEGTHRLGIMLPQTALAHQLMTRSTAIGRFSRERGFRVWVYAPAVLPAQGGGSSPLIYDNAEAITRLGMPLDDEGGPAICDAILLHDAPLARAIEASAFIDIPARPPLCLRRARGCVPEPLTLPASTKRHATVAPGLAVGGERHAVFALVRAAAAPAAQPKTKSAAPQIEAVMSQPLGYLAGPEAWQQYQRTYADLSSLLDFSPAWIAHDLDPSYVTTTWACGNIWVTSGGRKRAPAAIRTIAVQHHHAHAAAVLAEHGRTGPALAVVCDGTAYTPTLSTPHPHTGGELLRVSLAEYQQLARLRPLYLPAGDAAATETWRSGLALLQHAYGGRMNLHPAMCRLVPNPEQRRVLTQMVRDHQSCAYSSSSGRYIDGVAALLGLSLENHFEAQAALTLEAAADRATGESGGGAFPSVHEYFTYSAGEIDLAPLIREILARQSRGFNTAELAGLFHEQFARAWRAAVLQVSAQTKLRTVVLAGGVFCNERLLVRLQTLLEMAGLEVLRPIRLPPHDGALAYGQAAVAVAQLCSEPRP